MLPILIEIRNGVFINLNHVIKVVTSDERSTVVLQCGSNILDEAILPPFVNSFNLIIEKFHKTLISELN